MTLAKPQLIPAGTAGNQGVAERTSKSYFLSEEEHRHTVVTKLRMVIIDYGDFIFFIRMVLQRIGELLMASPVQSSKIYYENASQMEALQVQLYTKGEVCCV